MWPGRRHFNATTHPPEREGERERERERAREREELRTLIN
jgi:hypothetical protein